MDNYPDELAPEFDPGGGVATPFEEWWARVQHAFPHVPEEVAREWLHRHWRYSPWEWLPSADYRFHVEEWPTERLLIPGEITYRLDNFAASIDYRLEHAEFVLKQPAGWRPWLAEYMREHGQFPSRPILLDNRDRHLFDDVTKDNFPSSYLLIEGHNRLEYATYWAAKGGMKPAVQFWVMTRTAGGGV